MRVLHIDMGREMRGGQWQVLYLLRAAEHERVLCCRESSPLGELASESGIHVIHRIAGRYDLIHAHDAHAHTRAVLGSTPVVVSRRVAFPVSRSLLSRVKYARAKRYIAVSEFVKTRLVEAGIDETHVSVVYDGVPSLPRSTHLGPIIAPATDDPMKGSDLVREAARLAGVEIHFSRDLMEDLAAARLMVYLSREEGLGSAALLAMSAGVPVIASRVGGLVEAVEDRVTGLLVENDATSIAAAIRDMLQEDPVGMGDAARRRWMERFTIEQMVAGTEAVYREALG